MFIKFCLWVMHAFKFCDKSWIIRHKSISHLSVKLSQKKWGNILKIEHYSAFKFEYMITALQASMSVVTEVALVSRSTFLSDNISSNDSSDNSRNIALRFEFRILIDVFHIPFLNRNSFRTRTAPNQNDHYANFNKI